MNAAWSLAPEHSGTLLRLQNLLQHLQGFRAIIAQHNRPAYRDGLIQHLLAAIPDGTVLDIKTVGGFAAFEQALEAASAARVVHLINLESLERPAQLAFFHGINYHREHLARRCGASLVFWLPEPLIRDLALEAADFWAWREMVFDFGLEVKVADRRVIDWSIDNRDTPTKQARIQEIKGFLATTSAEPSPARARLKRELGWLYFRSGENALARQLFEEAAADWGELDVISSQAMNLCDLAAVMATQGEFDAALTLLNERVLPICEKLGDERGKTVALGRVADILKLQGQFNEALHILKSQVLPGFEKLGDIRGKALALGRIADDLQKRGQVDEALLIRESEELPIFKKLGDIREEAIVLGKIADVLQARGQLDEALQIREIEQLPIFEKLGDIRAKTATMGRIASIFRARGQLDEALRIYETEALPIYEKLGDIRSQLLARTNIATLLLKIDPSKHAQRIRDLLRSALTDARHLRIPETEKIEEIMKAHGLDTD